MSFRMEKLRKDEIHTVLDTILEIFPNADVSLGKDDVVFVAREDETIIGFVHLKESKKRVILQGFGVKERSRGLGIGNALIEYVMRYYEDISKPIFLKVKAGNPVIELYSKHGFVPKKFGNIHVLVRKKDT